VTITLAQRVVAVKATSRRLLSPRFFPVSLRIWSRLDRATLTAAAEHWLKGETGGSVVKAALLIERADDLGYDVREHMCVSLAINAMSALLKGDDIEARPLFEMLYEAYGRRLPMFRPAGLLPRDYAIPTSLTVGYLEVILDRFLLDEPRGSRPVLGGRGAAMPALLNPQYHLPLRHPHGGLLEPVLIEDRRRVRVGLGGVIDLPVAHGIAPRPIRLAAPAAAWGRPYATLYAHGYVLL